MGDGPDQSAASPGGVVTVQVSFSTPDGVINGQVQVDTGPMRLVELVPTALQLTDIMVAKAARREQAAGRSISCRVGCAACCRHMVALSAPECFFLADWIASRDEALRGELLARFRAAQGQLTEGKLWDVLRAGEYDDEAAIDIAQRYFALWISCPFLENESCGIYPHRPLACREYNVTSPAAWCVDPINNPIARVPMPPPLSVTLARLVAELTGERPRLIPLTMAPVWVAEHGDLRRQTWPGLELFKRFLALLEQMPASR